MTAVRSREVWLVVLILSYWGGQTMMRPLVAPYASRLGAPAPVIGFILAGHAVPAFLMALPTGHLADRFGYRRVIVAGSSLMLAGGMSMLVPALPMLGIGQVLTGLGALGVWLAIQGLMILAPSPELKPRRRSSRVANLSLAVLAGQLAGPIAGGILADEIGYVVTFAIYCVTIVLTFVAGVRSTEKQRASLPNAVGTTRRATVGDTFRNGKDLVSERGVLATVLVSFCALYLLDVRNAFVPLYLDGLGVSAKTIGALLSLAGATALLARPALPWLVARCRVGTVAALTLVPGSLSLGAFASTRDLIWLFALAGVSGLSLGMAQPLTLLMTAEYTVAGQHGASVALRLMGNRAAQWINPLFFGALLSAGSFALAFAVTGGVVMIVGIGAAARLNEIQRTTVAIVEPPDRRHI